MQRRHRLREVSAVCPFETLRYHVGDEPLRSVVLELRPGLIV